MHLSYRSKKNKVIRIIIFIALLVLLTTLSYKILENRLFDGDIDFESTTQTTEASQETPIAADEIDNYQVEPNLPRVLFIDKLSIKARILPMGLNEDNTIQAPVNINDSGWYNGSAQPGQPGAMLIDAHSSGRTRQGLFAYLDTLVVGDEIKIERGDGAEFVYSVAYIETVPLSEVDMKKALAPYGEASEGVNLITCTGEWIESDKTYDHRVIVYAIRN